MSRPCDRILRNAIAGREIKRDEVAVVARSSDGNPCGMELFQQPQVRGNVCYVLLSLIYDEVIVFDLHHASRGLSQTIEQSWGRIRADPGRVSWKIHRQPVALTRNCQRSAKTRLKA